ncbi:Ig-like domain-containing protein [Velocimicrobium porci]|uniref:Peptidase M14 n=1 Tax=Velocimicrobium porci TaxID=2606634 RepID=A0A6L5XX67_9FIRM|nr:Ig-like domain-containing protein [Velocimicrobium porci]MSS63224.1 peptidase M14 [Velocimicrobium porci]
MRKTKKRQSSYAILMAIVLMVTMINPSVAASTSKEVKAATTALTFENVSDNGEDKISMTDERTFESIVTLADNTTKEQAEQLAKEVTWSLSRTKGIQDTKAYPYQFLGGKLDEWKVFDKDTALFTAQTEAVEKDGKYVLKLTLKNKYLFGADGIDSRPRYIRSTILDYVGDYQLKCEDKSGNVLGQTTVRVNPYDSYCLNAEFQTQLNEAEAYAAKNSDIYAEVRSMGKTTNGYDMPYIIISDSKQTLTDYQNLKQKAETDPATLIKQIKAGTLDYKIPVLYSNVHADENPGADAPMQFIWKLLKSDQNNGVIEYKMATGFTAAGKAQFEKEMKERKTHWSSLIKDWPTGIGFIRDGNEASGKVDLEKYYKIETIKLNVKDLLKNVFFIVVPEENADARTVNTRQNGNGFDLNRDNMFQTQVETQNMARMIASWNPATFIELHGFVSGFQIEPCSPTHEPNIEYDLFAKNGIHAGEAFGNVAIANNDSFNSYAMPLRDYMTEDENGKPCWVSPWDDMSTSYTPQYSLLHGTVAFTIEVPKGNEEATKALTYGLIGQGKYVADHKDEFFLNQLEGYRRGIENIDDDANRPWYVDIYDNQGAEADAFRPKYKENDNFFPEYYVIPLDAKYQKNTDAAYEMGEFLLRNGVKLHKLNKDVKVGNTTYKKGSYVVNMHQAKRNVANGALYDGVLITGWTDLYSEPITAFSQCRGFDCDVITKKGAFADSALTQVTKALEGKTTFTGSKNAAVIISNNSVAAVKAVNTLLNKKAKVGYITSGANKGDFVTSYENYLKVKDDFVLIAKGTTTVPKAKVLAKTTLYIPGDKGEFITKSDGTPFGLRNYRNLDNPEYNWDFFAYGKQLGFEITHDLSKADVIIGNEPINEEETKAIKAGTPYICAGVDTLENVKKDLITSGFDYYIGHPYWIEDALTTVKYVDSSMVTDKYVMDKDNIMYGYGGGSITKVPEGAKVLIKTTNDDPLEGFMMASSLKKYKNSVQAIEYKKGKLDLTVFANTLTNKAHQQDDYRYASNAIFSKTLGKTYTLTKKATSLKTNVTKKTLKKGASFTIKATLKPALADTKKVTFTSSKKNVATVNSKGKVTAKGKGTCTITVKTTDGSKLVKKVKITVK